MDFEKIKNNINFKSEMSFHKKKIKAFTLAELLVTLSIIGILILMALPVLMPLIVKTKAMEAKIQLEHLVALEKSYYYEHDKYTNNMDDLGFEQSKLVSEGGRANYKIEIIEATNTNFRAKATSITDFDQDGNFNVWETDKEGGLKESTKD